MGVFGDVFEGDQGAKAAEAQRSFLNLTKAQTIPLINEGFGLGRNDVATGAGRAREALATGYGAGTGAIGAGSSDAIRYLDDGSSGALARLAAARGSYDPVTALAGKYGEGTDLYMDALGARGADGTTRAQQAFTAGPGYDFQLDQGLEAINRRRNAAGMLASGNADRDATDYAMGVAKQEYGGWMDRLAGLVNPELAATTSAATGTAGLGRDEASLLSTTGVAKAGVANERGKMLADLAQKLGTNTATVDVNEGKSMADLAQARTNQWVGMNLNLAPQFAKTYSDEAAARTAGSANIVNAGMQIGKAIAGFA